MFKTLFLVVWLLVSFGVTAEEKCVPEGVEKDYGPATMPSTIPANFPMPSNPIILSADTGGPDDYNPYGYARVELLVNGDTASIFSFYEKQLAASGYKIVMWENDIGAMGFRARAEDIDQVTISLNSYDCRVYVSLSFSFLP